MTASDRPEPASPPHGARPDRVYLDWNATAPPLPEALAAMREAADLAWANPASVHADGRRARACVEEARAAIAALAASDPRDVVLTGGGTEANNLAVRAPFVARAGVLVTSRLEHPSVTRVAEALEREGRARVRWLRVLPTGVVDLEDLARALAEPEVRLVALQAVNHETGVVQPIADALALTDAAGVPMHVDAVQAWGRVAIAGLEGAATRSLAGHKLRGPKGIGALVLGCGARVEPVLVGGAQERGIRPGTVDPVAASGLAVAARHAAAEGARSYAAVARLRDELEAALRVAAGATDPAALDVAAQVNGEGAPRAPHVTNLSFAGWDGAELVAALDLEGVSVSSGSACSAGTHEPSPIIEAMLGPVRAKSAVRLSLGPTTTGDDAARARSVFARVLARAGARR